MGRSYVSHVAEAVLVFSLDCFEGNRFHDWKYVLIVSRGRKANGSCESLRFEG